MVITSFIVFYTGLWLAGFMISDYDNLRYEILVPNNAVPDLILSTDYIRANKVRRVISSLIDSLLLTIDCFHDLSPVRAYCRNIPVELIN